MKITSRELLPGDIKVADLRLVKLQPGEALFVRINVAGLGDAEAGERLEAAQHYLQTIFPDNEVITTSMDVEVGP